MSVILKRSKSYLYYKAALGTIIIAFGISAIIDIFGDFSNQWYWLFFATVLANLIDDTFAHRICGHNMFRVNVKSVTYKVLTFLASVLQGYGASVQTIIWHRAHHMFADQGKKDTLNPREFWYREASALPYYIIGKGTQYEDPTDLVDRSLRISGYMIRDPWTRFCEKYDLIISAVTLTVLYILSFDVLFKLFVLARIMSSVAMILAGISHFKLPLTYRNFDTPDKSHNNILFHYMLFGAYPAVLQNNHHGMPRSPSLRYRWWEIDVTAPLVYLLKYLMEDKQITAVNED